MQKIELLAPVGSREALVAAVENGADAVYLGGKSFSARQSAANFTDEEMAEAITFAHLRDVKVYVAVNTLIDNGEMDKLVDYLCFLADVGADAVIIQDPAVAKIARKIVPDLEIHASTQMTVHNVEGVKLLEEYGFTRVVLAREMELTEISLIAREVKTEIEVFVHGALCICYSGQCLMSSMIGGRSGNRGRCAQPCRLPYTLVDDTGKPVDISSETGDYILSPKDLNTITLLPELIKAGVTSFKIEGRMKRPEYVATVVRNYREAIDRYLFDQQAYHVPAQQQKELIQIFNRDFTTGYLEGRQGIGLMSHRRPNNRGLKLGRVVRYNYDNRTATIKLDEDLAIGDGIEIWVSVGGRVGTIVTRMDTGLGQISEASAGMEVSIPVPNPVKLGDRAFKTNDAQLLERAQTTFTSPTPLRRIPLDVNVAVRVGEPMVVRLTDVDGNTVEARTAFIAETAIKRPLNYEAVESQMNRLGNTVFTIKNMHIDIEGEVMVPQSEMNAVRREAVSLLEELRLAAFRKGIDIRAAKKVGRELLTQLFTPCSRGAVKPELSVRVEDTAGVQAAVDNGADVVYFGGESFSGRSYSEQDYGTAYRACRDKGRKIVFSLPRIIKPSQISEITSQLEIFRRIKPDGIAVANIGAVHLVNGLGIPVYADYPLNIFNNISLEFYREQGISQATLSPELSLAQVESIMQAAKIPLECLVHGEIELMVTEYCAIGSLTGGLGNTTACPGVCRRGQFGLKDRLGMIFPVETDQYCRMHIFNTKELAMLSHLSKFGEIGVSSVRIEAKLKAAKEVAYLTSLYRQVLDVGLRSLSNDVLNDIEHKNITRGHFFRGVLQS